MHLIFSFMVRFFNDSGSTSLLKFVPPSKMAQLTPKSSTFLSPMNVHSKRRIRLISGRFYFPRRNSGQTVIKDFVKSGKVISENTTQRTLFSVRTGLFSLFFFLQLADTINIFEVILAAREVEYKKRFVKCFLNVIYFGYLETLHCSSFLSFLIFQSTIGQSFLDRKNDIYLKFPLYIHCNSNFNCSEQDYEEQEC